MKIEFKKVPQVEKDFKAEMNSVKLEGKFCKISPSLVKIKSNLQGSIEVECCRCGTQESIEINEPLELVLCDGVFSNESEDIVIEIENGVIDFDEVIMSEIASIQSDYHTCKECLNNTEAFEKEY